MPTSSSLSTHHSQSLLEYQLGLKSVSTNSWLLSSFSSSLPFLPVFLSSPSLLPRLSCHFSPILPDTIPRKRLGKRSNSSVRRKRECDFLSCFSFCSSFFCQDNSEESQVVSLFAFSTYQNMLICLDFNLSTIISFFLDVSFNLKYDWTQVSPMTMSAPFHLS